MYRYVIADVFTDVPLEGNPVAVFLDAEALPAERMQRIAREMNLSESVFVLPADAATAEARIRIFTPHAELPFAGHPVLGTAVVLGEGRDEIRLQCAAGVVPVALHREDGVVSGRMTQPVPTWRPFDRAGEVLAALGVPASALPVEVYTNGPHWVVVVLDEPAQVAALQPDMGALARALPDAGVSCAAGSGTTWTCRVFGPSLGVPEDPATGSAAGPLALHLARHGRTGFGTEIEIRQGAEIGRPSRLLARVTGAPTPDGHRVDRVQVAGSAVTVAYGTLVA